MEKNDLYREWVRVLDMCEGTNSKPQECIRFYGLPLRPYIVTPAFGDGSDDYTFALALVEGKPVFKHDAVYKGRTRLFVESRHAYNPSLLYVDSGNGNGCQYVSINELSLNPPFIVDQDSTPRASRPTKMQMIKAVAKEFGVSILQAEIWLK